MQSCATLGERKQESDTGTPDSRLRGWDFVLGGHSECWKDPSGKECVCVCLFFCLLDI